MNINCFENLSNEIYYEIFDYLDGNAIHKAFSNLNTRFQQLITSSLFFLRISFKSDIKYCYQRVIIPNKNQIISLHLWNSFYVEQFLKYCAIDSSFNRLQSIVLCGINQSKLLSLISSLQSVSYLHRLIIEFNTDQNSYIDLNEIYRLILSLSSLKYNSLLFCNNDQLDALIPVSINEQFSSIETLIMNHYCDINGLISILHQTPHLKHLTCDHLIESIDKIDNELSIKLSNLIYINIRHCQMSFTNLEKLIKKICCPLKVLYISKFSELCYSVPGQWEELIVQHMPYLHKFIIKCPMNLNDTFQNPYFDLPIHQFSSKFWLNREWKLIFEIQARKIFFGIFPIKIKQFNSDKHFRIITYPQKNNSYTSVTSVEFSSPVELYITDYQDSTSWNNSFINQLNSILNAVKFRSLYLDRSTMMLSTFIKLLHFLPNLESLKMSFLFHLNMNDLSAEEEEDLRLISINNNITKVSQIMNLNQLMFLINLYPRMEHFQVCGVEDKDLIKIVSLILKKTMTNIPHLRTLQINLWSINDGTVEKLKNMIHSEKLLSNYTIKYTDTYFFLEWKDE